MRSGRAERGGWVRAAQHSLSKEFGVVPAAARSRRGTCFCSRARDLPAPVRRAGGACLRRVPAFSPLKTSAHLVWAVAGVTRICSIREDARCASRYRIHKHHDRFSPPFGCILRVFRGYPASMTRFVFHVWDANPGRWNQGGKCKGYSLQVCRYSPRPHARS